MHLQILFRNFIAWLPRQARASLHDGISLQKLGVEATKPGPAIKIMGYPENR